MDTPDDYRTVLMTMVLIAGLVIAGMMTPVAAKHRSGTLTTIDAGDEVPLYAGQDELVGSVAVTNNSTHMVVTYEVNETAGWYLTETHLHVADSVDDVPQTKKGNPKVGHFAYGDTYFPARATVTITIPLSDLSKSSNLTVAAHAEVVQLSGATSGNSPPQDFATDAELSQGTQVDGDPVAAAYSDPDNATGAPDGAYVSLGVNQSGNSSVHGEYDGAEADAGPANGSLVVSFDGPVYNVTDAPDVVVYEGDDADDDIAPETADAYVLADGEWHFAGTVTSDDGTVDIPDGLETIEEVMLVDKTNTSEYGPDANGFDVDAVGAASLVSAEETAWGDGYDGALFTDHGSWATYFEYNGTAGA